MRGNVNVLCSQDWWTFSQDGHNQQGDGTALQMSNLGTEGTMCLITTVMGKVSQKTYSLGVLLFTDALIMIIWPEKNRNLACIHETLPVQCYTATGSNPKVGWNYQCPLEWFYLHQASFTADYNYLNFNKVTANNSHSTPKSCGTVLTTRPGMSLVRWRFQSCIMFPFCAIFVPFCFVFLFLITFLGSKLKHGRILRAFLVPDRLPHMIRWAISV